MSKSISSSERLIEELSRVHRTPKGVEQFGVEVVPEDMRTVTWKDLFAIMFAFMLNPVMYMLPGLAVIVGGLPFWGAVWAITLGNALAFIGFCGMATLGADYGIPGQVGIRSIVGYWGSRIVTSPLRVIASVYWFAAQTLGGALAIAALLQSMTGQTYSFVAIAVIFAIVQSVLAIVGFDALKYFVRVVLPLMLLLSVITIYLLISAKNPSFAWAAVSASSGKTLTWAGFGLWTSMIVGTWSTMITDSADFCRYARSRKDMWIGFFFGAVGGTFVAAFIGAYAAVAGGDWNPFSVIAKLNPGGFVLFLLFVALSLNTISINILNHYTGGFSLVNTFPKIGRFWSTVIIAVTSVILCFFPTFINNATAFIMELGNIFTPIAGVLLFDYFFLKKTHLDVMGLFEPKGRYRFWGGINLVALVSVVCGYFIFKALPPASIQAFSTIIITGGLYMLLSRLVGSFSSSYAGTIVPAEAEITTEEINTAIISSETRGTTM